MSGPVNVSLYWCVLGMASLIIFLGNIQLWSFIHCRRRGPAKRRELLEDLNDEPILFFGAGGFMTVVILAMLVIAAFVPKNYHYYARAVEVQQFDRALTTTDTQEEDEEPEDRKYSEATLAAIDGPFGSREFTDKCRKHAPLGWYYHQWLRQLANSNLTTLDLDEVLDESPVTAFRAMPVSDAKLTSPGRAARILEDYDHPSAHLAAALRSGEPEAVASLFAEHLYNDSAYLNSGAIHAAQEAAAIVLDMDICAVVTGDAVAA